MAVSSDVILPKRILLQYARTFLVLCCFVGFTIANEHDSVCDEQAGSCPEPIHTVIRLSKRDDELARRIAADHGMEVKGKPFMDSHYFLHEVGTRSRRHKREVMQRLQDHPAVEWAEEQRPRKRVKRDYVHTDVRRSDPTQSLAEMTSPRHPAPSLPFPDPLYREQWYLVGGAKGGFDMNVREAWLLGYAGRNVSISILDDGIQRDHVDLAINYDPMASSDINDHDDDPTPQDNGDNKHGTRCAGEVAAVAGNNHCGVGVAYHSNIGGVRMLDGPVSDSVEAASLSLNQNHIDIYSASWGPEDDGKTFDGPGPMAREAFYRGIKEGRNGKGNIFVWASGNGGSRQDSCSADGYTTSVYTLSISSATHDNKRPWYLEECPSSIATTYSSANMGQPAIVTVDVPQGCTRQHTGTSASAPLAAGIIALALEANPSLTWRDMQHVVLRTANPTPLLENPGWSINGVGRHISNKFGYGLMDAGNIVKLAKKWTTVPEQHLCTYEYDLEKPNPRPLTGNFRMNFTLEVSGCETGTPVLYLEHVQVLSTIRFGKRGDLKLTLFSPQGTTSVLLPPRPQDYNSNGIHKWPFLSVQMWGEDPRGTWTLMIESVSTNKNIGGKLHNWSLLLYGTQEPAQPNDPQHPVGSPSSSGTPTQSLLGRATERITSQQQQQQRISLLHHEQQQNQRNWHSSNNNQAWTNHGGVWRHPTHHQQSWNNWQPLNHHPQQQYPRYRLVNGRWVPNSYPRMPAPRMSAPRIAAPRISLTPHSQFRSQLVARQQSAPTSAAASGSAVGSRWPPVASHHSRHHPGARSGANFGRQQYNHNYNQRQQYWSNRRPR